MQQKLQRKESMDPRGRCDFKNPAPPPGLGRTRQSHTALAPFNANGLARAHCFATTRSMHRRKIYLTNLFAALGTISDHQAARVSSATATPSTTHRSASACSSHHGRRCCLAKPPARDSLACQKAKVITATTRHPPKRPRSINPWEFRCKAFPHRQSQRHQRCTERQSG